MAAILTPQCPASRGSACANMTPFQSRKIAVEPSARMPLLPFLPDKSATLAINSRSLQ
jgi:hypothetical protein